MDLVAPILDIGNEEIDKKMKILMDRMEELNARKSDIESETRAGLDGQILKHEVAIWLQKVQEFDDDKHDLLQKFEKVKFLSRASLGRKLAKKIEEVEQHLQKGRFSDGLMVYAALRLTTTLVGETAAVIMEEIWTSLVSDDVQRIGVYGMGGSGKTTIVNYIHNRILERSDKFGHVYWITVSKDTSVLKLQDGIASAMRFNGLEKIEDEANRASKLSRELEKKERCVLIFDDMWEAFNLEEVGIPDMWEAFNLEEVGIPERTVGFRCKLILTTRSLDVCRRMSSTCIKMELLSDNEAWDLFLDNVGRDISMTSEVKTIAKLVSNECARLPLAIIAVGRSMKGVVDRQEWRNTLTRLRDSTMRLDEMKEVVEQLKYSYTQLKDEKAQRCLLYCALYPKDYVIAREELIPLLIAEEIIEGMESSWEEGFEEWHTILNKLENACLLESCTHHYRTGKHVKMHVVIRDMALQIMGGKSMVEAGVHLSDIPIEEKWTEVLETVSLMDNNIEEIPIDASPRCSKLKTLWLSGSRSLKMIPDSFFVHMPSLSVLDLSDSVIEKLPNSISDLENLTALMLRKCLNLYYVPSLAKLRRLRMLDLCHTKIEEVPEGMEMLANLQYLNLCIKRLKTFPTGILPKLTQLQCLILYWGFETGEELIGLKKLERLVCKFYDLNDFNLYVRSLEHHQRRLPKSYGLYVGSEIPYEPFYADDDGKHKKIVRYHGIQREGEAESKSEESILLLPNDVEDLHIEYCDDVRSLSDVRVHLLSNLEVLRLDGLKNLCAASSHSPLLLHCTFSCLRKLCIEDCRNIKRLFTPGLVPHLQNLEEINVRSCEGMEEIVAEEEEEGMIKNDHNFSLTLPKLKTLSLYQLPELKCIMCRRRVMVCDSIETIQISECPKVKRLPLNLPLNRNGQPSPPPLLTSIEMDDGCWWNLLEWDNPIAKDVLQPFIKLRDSTRGLDEIKIEQLTFRYTWLQDEKAQRCLLYCALYPKDYVIARQELISLLIAEEIIEGMESSREEGFDKWHTILNKLENACLLESYTDYSGKQVKMRDVIRDMALQIMGGKSMVEAGVRLSEFPSEEKWTEVLETVSLMDNNIEEIPTDASPRCSKLKTLLLSESESLEKIPDSFFVHMPSLSVLDLSNSVVEKLPNSISDLENLTALMLRKCLNLYYVPSLAKLRRLRMLDLCHTKIEEVPEGMEMLANLQYLNLFIEGLETFPTGILPKLTRLQCLILFCGSETLYIKGEELIGLKKLERLVCKFYDLNDFNLYVRYLEHHQRRLPKSYYLYVGSLRYGGPFYVDDEDKHQKSVGYGIRREGEAESKSEESILLLQNDVEELCIEDCNDVRSLSDVRVQLLSNLEVLWLEGLKNLCAASSHSPLLLHCTFSCLRELHIDNCQNIKRLFTPGLVPHLQNLEEIEVWSCEGMEEIVAEEEGMIKNDHNFSITLPKLKTLFLYELPELKCIMCRRGVMVCDSILNIRIYGCPKVKRLPLYLPPLNGNGQPSPPPLLTSIKIDDEYWWNLLEWDNPIAKDVLQPFIKR